MWTLLSCWSQNKIDKMEKKDKYLGFARELKTVEHEGNGDTSCNWYSCYSHERIGERTGGLRNKRTIENHPNYSIIGISQNTKMNHGDLRKLAVTYSPVRSHQLTLVWKTRKGLTNNNNRKDKGISSMRKDLEGIQGGNTFWYSTKKWICRRVDFYFYWVKLKESEKER